MNFKLKDGEQVRTIRANIASATVIEPGKYITFDANKLVVEADETATEIAYCPNGSADGETICEITIGNDFTLIGTSDANFADTDKGEEVDLVISGSAQLIDLGASVTDVLKVGVSESAGTVGSTSNVEVKINKPLF